MGQTKTTTTPGTFPITREDVEALRTAVQDRIVTMVRELAGDDEIDEKLIDSETARILSMLAIGEPFTDSIYNSLVHDAVVTAEKLAGFGGEIALN